MAHRVAEITGAATKDLLFDVLNESVKHTGRRYPHMDDVHVTPDTSEGLQPVGPLRLDTMRPLTQMLNSNDPEVADFAYQYLHTNSEASLYPPDDAVKNLLRMSSYVDKKLGSISASRVIDLSILDELGTKRYQRAPR